MWYATSAHFKNIYYWEKTADEHLISRNSHYRHNRWLRLQQVGHSIAHWPYTVQPYTVFPRSRVTAALHTGESPGDITAGGPLLLPAITPSLLTTTMVILSDKQIHCHCLSQQFAFVVVTTADNIVGAVSWLLHTVPSLLFNRLHNMWTCVEYLERTNTSTTRLFYMCVIHR